MNDEHVAYRRTADSGQLVMPFYLICDVSYSMRGDMRELNDGVRRLRTAILADPVVDDIAQICLMSFSDDAKVLMPMAKMSEVRLPRLAEEGGTNYGAAFRELARAIEHDGANLTRHGYQVYRPCALFLTDGKPTDRTWHETFTRTLTYDHQTGQGMKTHPIFAPFGFRNAPEEVLKQLAYPPEKGKWYHARTTSVEQALAGILHIIMQTVIMSDRGEISRYFPWATIRR
jgi:uncharacterized protein YegL